MISTGHRKCRKPGRCSDRTGAFRLAPTSSSWEYYFYAPASVNRTTPSDIDTFTCLLHMSKPVIHLEKIARTYRVGTEMIHALRSVTLDIHRNEYVALMGSSGSGKSTLMNVLGCLDTPTSGSYFLDDKDVSG